MTNLIVIAPAAAEILSQGLFSFKLVKPFGNYCAISLSIFCSSAHQVIFKKISRVSHWKFTMADNLCKNHWNLFNEMFIWLPWLIFPETPMLSEKNKNYEPQHVQKKVRYNFCAAHRAKRPKGNSFMLRCTCSRVDSM